MFYLTAPPTKAGVLKRSIAETITDMNLTTLSTPLDEAVENSPTTVITPLLANNQTTLSNVQQNVATATVVNEPETTTVGTSTVQHDDQIMALNLPQGVKNEIAQVVSKEAATDLRVKANSKFDYTETVLDENLEDSIRNSVRNEIEFEQDIIAAEVQHLQNVTDEEVRQKLDDEVQLIQSVLQEISTKPSAAIDVLAECKLRLIFEIFNNYQLLYIKIFSNINLFRSFTRSTIDNRKYNLWTFNNGPPTSRGDSLNRQVFIGQ